MMDLLRNFSPSQVTTPERNNSVIKVIFNEQHTKLSGNDVVAVFPRSDTDKSSSGGGFSLKTSLPLVASSGSSGSLRLVKQKNNHVT
jgi:hypothetical protein